MFGLFQGDGKIDAGELGFAEEPTVSPAGVYQVRVRVIEAKDLSAIDVPRCTKSSTDTDEPNRPKHRRDRELPR